MRGKTKSLNYEKVQFSHILIIFSLAFGFASSQETSKISALILTQWWLLGWAKFGIHFWLHFLSYFFKGWPLRNTVGLFLPQGLSQNWNVWFKHPWVHVCMFAYVEPISKTAMWFWFWEKSIKGRSPNGQNFTRLVDLEGFHWYSAWTARDIWVLLYIDPKHLIVLAFNPNFNLILIWIMALNTTSLALLWFLI